MRTLRPLLLFLLLAPVLGCGDDRGWIMLQNDTASDVVSVSIDPCGGAAPGPDRLGAGRIAPGAREGFRVDFGCYDVLAVTQDGMEGRWQVGVNSDEPTVVLYARRQQP
jgi:hypothetical protein